MEGQLVEVLRERDRALERLERSKTLLVQMERIEELGLNVESMGLMLRATREITYWREAYERVVPEDQWVGSFKESSYYGKSLPKIRKESGDIASKPPRPKTRRQIDVGSLTPYHRD